MATGSLARRGKDPKSWTLRIDLPADPLTGKRKQKSVAFHGTKKEAEERLRALLTAAKDGDLSGSRSPLLRDFLARWFRDYVESLPSPKTIRTYRLLADRYILPALGHWRLADLTPDTVLVWLHALRQAPRGDGKPGPLAAHTIKHVYDVLHAALNDAIEWRVLTRNPVSAVKRPVAGDFEGQVYTPEQAVALLGRLAADGVFWETLFYVMLSCQLRLSELTGLRWRDVDLEQKELAIRQQIYRVPTVGIVTKAAKTKRSRRPIALDDQAVILLRRLAAGCAPDGLVFSGRGGAPLDEHTIRRHLRQAQIAAEVPIIRPHDLRHTGATLLLKANVQPKIVSERLGHSNVNITQNLYQHVLKGMQQDAADALGALLKRPESPPPSEKPSESRNLRSE